FTGKKLEPESKLFYFNQRWYDSETGRFLTEDPAAQGPNPYAYCANNPLIYTDPDGELFWLIPAIISAASTVAVSSVTVIASAAAGAASWAVGTAIAVTPYTMAAGAGYGGLSAAVNGENILQGVFDGATAGAALPGMIAGGVIGAGVGAGIGLVTGDDIGRSMTAWGGLGAGVGGALGMIYGAALTGGAAAGSIGAVTGGVAMTAHMGYSIVEAHRMGKEMDNKKEWTDSKKHNLWSRKMRNKFGLGPALAIGMGKEFHDYLTPGRKVEWRDMQNNFYGAFRTESDF
ncbi:MAG: hypothetical protein GY710_21020, partial [Desulfobacteraceae bacterium]|nr:hypothetical protein [Desulfobacteraceae bacterium]